MHHKGLGEFVNESVALSFIYELAKSGAIQREQGTAHTVSITNAHTCTHAHTYTHTHTRPAHDAGACTHGRKTSDTKKKDL